jgi:NAD(P)-dependent dehydrogenase (short-subunit alcohol dehydrogenase family)
MTKSDAIDVSRLASPVPPETADTNKIKYSKDKIRINCVCPGVIAYVFSLTSFGFQFTDCVSTPMTQGSPEFAELIKPAVAIAPMDRMGTPQEIADACLFLCSSKATFVQGTAMVSFHLC